MGYLDEIAAKLAHQVEYKLTFKAELPEVVDALPKRKSVEICLDIDSGTWNISGEQRLSHLRNLLRGRPVFVEAGHYHSSVKIVF